MTDTAITIMLRQIGSLEDLFKEERQTARNSRERLYSKLEEIEKRSDTEFDLIKKEQQVQGDRIAALERSMVIMSPTVQEFVELKTNAQVAGRLGKLLWKLGGIIMAAAAGAAAMWAAFWTHFQWR